MLYNVDNFDVAEIIHRIKIVNRHRGNQSSGRNGWNYKNIICAFDIETSRIETGKHKGNNGKMITDYISVMYIWQFQIGKGITIIGRTWKQFNKFVDDIVNALDKTERLLIFVHNLSYEFQFLRDRKILGEKINERSVFCVDSRKILRFTCCDDKLEFRCSYIQTNMSLDEFTSKMQVQHQKLSGDEFDYSIYRNSDTTLTEKELEYCANDVIGLIEAMYKQMEVDGDDLYSLPLTSTGYVRRDIKKALRSVPHLSIQKQLPSFDEYLMLREAFRGGNTHANRYYARYRVDGVIKSTDISSSYPNTQVNFRFPVSQFHDVDKESKTIENVIEMIKHGKAVLMRIAIYNLELQNEFFPVPYISRDKARNIVNPVYDNGRILKADYIETTITDVDLSIILEEYKGDIEVLDCKFANYGYLPIEMRKVICDYFIKKTELKGVEGQEIYYMKSKNKLNAIYGMTAQNPIKISDCYINGEYKQGLYKDDKFLDLEKYGIELYKIAHELSKPIMPYQWGVWCTAWARRCLEDGINIVGYDKFLYCDTDSIYYIGNADISPYNKKAIKNSKNNGAYATDKKGVTHYMGVFEEEKEFYKSFITFGAKKYAYLDNEDKLHITIAGVNKKKGVDELNKYAVTHKLKDGIEALQLGFVFSDAGGTESVYNDSPIEHYTYKGKTFYVPTNIVIRESTYKLSLSDDYLTLINSIIDSGLTNLYFQNINGLPIKSLDFY